MPGNKPNILCIADSATRLTALARVVQGFGYTVHVVHFADQAVALAANAANGFDAVVIDEDMVLDGFSLAQSLKMVCALPILLVCDKGSEGEPKLAGVDLVTANGSREAIETALKKLPAQTKAATQGD